MTYVATYAATDLGFMAIAVAGHFLKAIFDNASALLPDLTWPIFFTIFSLIFLLLGWNLSEVLQKL